MNGGMGRGKNPFFLPIFTFQAFHSCCSFLSASTVVGSPTSNGGNQSGNNYPHFTSSPAKTSSSPAAGAMTAASSSVAAPMSSSGIQESSSCTDSPPSLQGKSNDICRRYCYVQSHETVLTTFHRITANFLNAPHNKIWPLAVFPTLERARAKQQQQQQ